MATLLHSLCLQTKPGIILVIEGNKEWRVVCNGEAEAAAVEEVLLNHVAPLGLALKTRYSADE
jgi:hypothetical protein